jgi:hypothetical protein
MVRSDQSLHYRVNIMFLFCSHVNMSAEDYVPFRVLKTNSHDETIALAAKLLVGRAAYEKAAAMYPREVIHLRHGARVTERSDAKRTGDQV